MNGEGGEFSRKLAVDELDSGGEIRRKVEADAAERAALAARLGLVDLGSLSAEVSVRRMPGGAVWRVSGRIAADPVQRCVVTLEPVPAHIEESFDELYAGEDYAAPDHDEDAEIPEAFDGHEIDVGELAAQVLSLALDPYPRAPGAALEGAGGADTGASDRRRPFEGLGDLLKARK